MDNGYIYKLTSPSNKVYIGQTVNIKKRIENYKYVNKNLKQQIRVYNSIKKYGFENHIFEIIEECSIDKLNERERYWQEYHDVLGENGLNCRYTKTNDKSGKVSKETSKKMSLSRLGRKLTDGHKEKIRLSLKGKVKSKEHIIKCVKSRINNGNNNHSEETKKKISIKNIETNKKKLTHPNKGRKFTDEHRLKLSISKLGKKSQNSRLVLNKITGIYYYSIEEAAKTINIKRQTLNAMLVGQNPNKTNFIYV